MEPLLGQGDKVAEIPVFGIRYFHRGSLVAFHLPYDPDNSGLARVVGLPGDYVQVKGGRLVLNQKPVYEAYLNGKSNGLRLDFPSNADSLVDNAELRRLQNIMYGEMIFNESVKVPEGCYFVLGDNRGQSLDSRTYGPIAQDSVFALPFFVYATAGTAGHPHLLHSADLEVK
jgi:signal peptidase I